MTFFRCYSKSSNKIFLLLCGGLFAWQQGVTQQVNSPSTETIRPNIILFLVDDMGWEDTSVPFWDSLTVNNRIYNTPNIKLLAAKGMKFTDAYAAPVCSPSRVSLMTGMNPAHTRVTNYCNPSHKDKTTDFRDSVFREVSWNVNGLASKPGIPHTVYAMPLPLLLRNNGYFTVIVGKGHLGPPGTPGSNPRNMGFEDNIAAHAPGSPQSYLGTQNYGNEANHMTIRAVPDLEQYYGTDTFLTKALTLEAIKALAGPVHNHQPFFLYLSHYAVHTPLMADSQYYKKYLDMGLSDPDAKYASMVEGVDQSLGSIMDFLKQKKIDKNTIIIFMSDNGGLAKVPPRGGEPNTQNYPLRAGKGSVYEGGIREPMIVMWPGVTKPGSVSHQYLFIADFFPTILRMAGIKSPNTVQHIDGKSFIPMLKDPVYQDTTRVLIWHFPNKWNHGPDTAMNYNYASAIRQGNWKLVYKMSQQKLELYNLIRDIKEQDDLSGSYPEKARQLARLLTEKLKDWNAQMPVYKSTGNPVPWPDKIKIN